MRGDRVGSQDEASFKSAASKESSKRSDEDVRILQRHTDFLCERHPPRVHAQLCRLMRYSKVSQGTRITREGVKADVTAAAAKPRRMYRLRIRLRICMALRLSAV